MRALFSAIGAILAATTLCVATLVALAILIARPGLDRGLLDSGVARRPATPLVQTVEDSAPLRQLMLARARRPMAAPPTPSGSAAPVWPQEAASRLAFGRLATERFERRMASRPKRRLDLGPNAEHQTAVAEAAILTGLSPAAIAALIDAEARKTASGAWDPNSSNPGSTARGLAQFLEESWLHEARDRERFLHKEALARGLIDAKGATKSDKARKALLAMRLEPRAAIITAAELAADNLVALARSGYAPKDDEAAAKLAYLAHHEGLSGARAHLAGRTAPDRAEKRLKANLIDEDRVKILLAAHGGAPNRAYAAWLEKYIAKRIKPERFHSVEQ